jgi:hypothetical protein
MARHHDNWARIINNDLRDDWEIFYTDSDSPTIAVSMDNEGRFKFKRMTFDKKHEDVCCSRPDQPLVDYILFIRHDTGFKWLSQQEWQALDKNKTITLEPWGRIEGTVKVGTQSAKNVEVDCLVTFADGYSNSRNEPRIHMTYEATTDESGKFSFDRVASSFVNVTRRINFCEANGDVYVWQGSHSTDRIALNPGETATVMVGGVGCPVVGKLVQAKEFEPPIHWAFAMIECRTPQEDIYALLDNINLAPDKAARDELIKSAMEAQDRNDASRLKTLWCVVAPDGTFRLDDVPEGDWQLTARITPTSNWVRPTGKAEHTFTIAAVPGGVSDEPIDLGTLEIKKVVPKNASMAERVKVRFVQQ